MIRTRADLERIETDTLAPYATLSRDAERLFSDSLDRYRTAFMRDHARILHSKAWRRLRGKTQVFLATEGDHYRNRMTHSLEVAQVSRELARLLGVNEDLAECIALAHDLGHTPFGHVGERKLDDLVRLHGLRFEHNVQSRRLLTHIEQKYPGSPGLNMTTAVLMGLAKHESPYDEKGDTGAEGPGIEAQIVNLADEIAYTSADCDDALRSGLITLGDIRQVPLWVTAESSAPEDLTPESRIHRTASALIELLITDVLAETERRLTEGRIQTLADVTASQAPLVSFSREMQRELLLLQKFLYQYVYLSGPVSGHAKAGTDIMERIFQHLMRSDKGLPEEYLSRLSADPRAQVASDFLSGMTDGFAADFAEKYC